MSWRPLAWVTAVALVATLGCSVHVASLTLAAPQPLDPDRVHALASRGWREGGSCRLWLVGIPFGLPQIDEAMDDALRPVGGRVLRDVTIYSVHPVYGLFGWHCYKVRGEVLG